MPERIVEACEIRGIACLRHARGSPTPLRPFIGPKGRDRDTERVRVARFESLPCATGSPERGVRRRATL